MTLAHPFPARSPGIVSEAKLAALEAGAADMPPPGRCTRIETRSSWVVLHEHRALKIKKPVRTALLDFSSPTLRRFDADEELRLNRRLAPAVYLGVRALQRHGSRWRLLGAMEPPVEGVDTDWVVEMDRLPESRMLDHIVTRAPLSETPLAALADVLCRFYRQARAELVEGDAWVARYVDEHRDNVDLLSRSPLASSAIAALLARHGEALDRLREPLADRARGGHPVEGHGDLRPEHVCLRDPPVVIDCLAYNARLRVVDPFDEITALGMECAVLGDGTIGPRLWALCEERLGGAPGGPLRLLFVSRRALLRARQTLGHLLDRPVRTPTRWRPLAARYLRAAEEALDELRSQGVRSIRRR